MEKPKVSIIMPVHNALPFLKGAIESILVQSFSDFEFIIVDDGSKDGSKALLEEYSRKDTKIRVIKNPCNMGIVYSLNQGIKMARGDYIVRMDADDISMKDRIKLQFESMEEDKEIAALGTSLAYIDSSGNDLGIVRGCALGNPNLSQTPLLHPTTIIRKSIIERYGLCYLEKYRYAEDYFLWLQLGKIGKISTIDKVLLKYRITNNVTRLKKIKGVILATLRVKKDAVFTLKIKPHLKDLFVFISESILFLLPSSLVIAIYLRRTFGKTKVCL